MRSLYGLLTSESKLSGYLDPIGSSVSGGRRKVPSLLETVLLYILPVIGKAIMSKVIIAKIIGMYC